VELNDAARVGAGIPRRTASIMDTGGEYLRARLRKEEKNEYRQT